MITSIREAREGEEQFLSELAIRSKSFWGYSKDFLEACRPIIKIDNNYLNDWPVVVILAEGKICGFYSLKNINGENRLDNLWIEPESINKGLGKKLFQHSLLKAKELGWTYFRLAGEPGAVGFYEKMGARLIGQVQSRLDEKLYLPHMELMF